jgi:hypothetical protein
MDFLDQIWQVISDAFQQVADFIAPIVPKGSIVKQIRWIAGIVLGVAGYRIIIRQRIRTHRYSQEEEDKIIEEKYEKNEDGLYPWEVDTDTSDKNIAKDAAPFKNEGVWRPQRGKWKIK